MRLRRATQTDRGSILVELALVLPVLMLLVGGMVEVGAAWRDKSSVIQASRQGARVVSHLGDDERSDLEALKAVMTIVPGQGLSDGLTVKRIVIFNASMGAAGVAACTGLALATSPIVPDPMAPPAPVGCNVYVENQLTAANLIPANFGSAGSYDNNWEPNSANRNTSLLAATEIGVYVEAERPFLTNIFPNQQSQKVRSFTIMRLEPQTP